MSIILDDRDDVVYDYVFHYDGRYTVKVEILVDECPDTFSVPLLFLDGYPSWEEIKEMAFEFCECINVTPYSLRPLKVSEWDD